MTISPSPDPRRAPLLLPRSSTDNYSSDPDTPPASVPGAVFNLSTSIVGAGIMSIPATLKVLGVIPALVLLVAVAFLCDASVEFLLRYTGRGGGGVGGGGGAKESYAGVMGESFGPAGAKLLQTCVVLTNAGALIMYLIIIADVVSGTGTSADGTVHYGVLQEWFGGDSWWNQRPAALLFIVVVVLLPLLLLRRVDSLRFSSAVSVLLAIVFVVISSVMAVYALSRGATKTPRLFPDFTILSSPFELFTAVPVLVLAFTFHFNVHPIRAELDSTSDMTRAVRASLVLCSAIYSAVGFFGYLLFGDATMPDILSNFDRTTTSPAAAGAASPLLNDAVRVSYALHLVLVFPLLFFSLRINLDGLLFPKATPLAFSRTRFLSITLGLLVFAYVAAIVIPDIWVLFQFFGSTTAVCLSLIFPAAIVLRDVHGISTGWDKVWAAVMVVLAVVTSSIAIASNVVSSVKG